MSEKRIGDLFKIRSRFLRSAHLDRDFEDPGALSGYVVTDFTRSCLGRVASGLKPRSGQRAWRMTGDFGCGKSSFALLLAHWFAGHHDKFPPQVRKVVDYHQFGVPRPKFVPALVTCSRQGLGTSILNSLHRMLNQIYRRGAKPKLALAVQRLVDANLEPTEDQIFQLVLEVNSRIIADEKGKGLLLILDELGKFLEFAALYPERQDVFLLQRLAEAASRSGHQPLFVISLLHQGFNAYADHLNQSAQREWEKVAGRFEEIVFNQPVEQIANIIAAAVNVTTQEIPKAQSRELRQAMERTLALGWFGSASAKTLSDLATRLYPLHPTVLPVLIRTFRRFGQNERSLFSFLLSNEPFGLRAFSEKHLYEAEPYRLHNFYDYVRTNFGHRLVGQSYRSHWNLIDSVVESFATEDELHVKALKTVGILNLLNDGDLLPTEESVVAALAGVDHAEQKHVRTVLEKLHKGKRVLYNRGRARGLSLWPHTSVDLEKAYDDARRAIDTPQRVATFLRELDGESMLVLTKAPERFDLQYCKIEGVRAELFARLLTVLDIKSPDEREVELLDVVKKLCVFVAQLPAQVLNTKKLPPTALAVRDTILSAREPAKLLFTDLPKACGFEPIPPDATGSKPIQAFVKTLKAALDDLRAAFPELQERLRKDLRGAFDLPGTFQQFRTALAARSEQILLAVTEPKLRAFCLRLMDDNLPESEWLESLGSYLALKPPSKWHDAEEDTFNNELARCATRFHRVESIVFAGGKSPKNAVGIRLAITQADGVEHEQVVHFTADEEHKLRDLQRQFEDLLNKDKRLGLVAASRAIWVNLEKERKSSP